MSDFRYVTRAECKNAKGDLGKLILAVQNEVRREFTFRYEFIGSAVWNMVTMDDSSNVGYDFDVNICVNDNAYSAKEIRNILRNAFDKFNRQFRYDYTEDSTRVLTIKVKDRQNSKILHSADFAVVRDCGDGRQQYIHFNKNQNSYKWQNQSKGYYELSKRIERIKHDKLGSILWQEVRELYLEKKNHNPMGKKSRALFAETINDIYQKNFN